MTIDSFGLVPGKFIRGKYQILEKLGDGWEGEVYLVREVSTGIERTAKLFYPHRNKHFRSSKFYAKKLHKLRECNIVIQYHFQDTVYLRGQKITYLISEFIEGELLSEFVARQQGKRLNYFIALKLLHNLSQGLEEIHNLGEYHGDLHTDNIIVGMKGLEFEAKLLDLYNLGSSNAPLRKDDIVELIHIFHEILGGNKMYSKLPKEIKNICCGL
ncbi:MAG: protein kinase, partial [Candidatus Aenigmarchaeota archaeon]|nr:protein kinase [Candidatus Aenigmarchaeota archaeon]